MIKVDGKTFWSKEAAVKYLESRGYTRKQAFHMLDQILESDGTESWSGSDGYPRRGFKKKRYVKAG